jgi:hypothetical protein
LCYIKLSFSHHFGANAVFGCARRPLFHTATVVTSDSKFSITETITGQCKLIEIS